MLFLALYVVRTEFVQSTHSTEQKGGCNLERGPGFRGKKDDILSSI